MLLLKKINILASLFFVIILFNLYSLIFVADKECSKKIIFEGELAYYEENLDEIVNVSSKHQYVKILMFLEEPDYFGDLSFERPLISDTMEEAQQKIKNIRSYISEIIYQYNYSVAIELQDTIDLANTVIGQYSFTLDTAVKTENFDENLINSLESILNSDLSVEEIYISEVTDNQDELSNVLPMINVDSMINTGPFGGKDVNVGIVEASGVPQELMYSLDYSNRNIVIEEGAVKTSWHADSVTMIAAGNNGIARESNIYATIATKVPEIYMKWLIENGVNVVNTSFGDGSEHGKYTSNAKQIDQIIKNTFVTMVGSAGNNSGKITSPKTAYNYITVGNSHDSLTLRYFESSYVESDGYGGSKPNLMAPGLVTTNAGSDTGTSFSAPQVTGCIALLMEEFPFLIGYPELCISIVTSSASPMSNEYNSSNDYNIYDSSGLHNEIGSGLLNYEKMREAARNSVSIIRAKGSAIGDLELETETLEFSALKNQRIRASLSWLAKGTDSENFTNYDLYLQQKNDNNQYVTLMYVNGEENNVEFLDYKFVHDGTYRLLIKQKNINSQKDYIGMSYVLIDGAIEGSKSGATLVHLCENVVEQVFDDSNHCINCYCGFWGTEEHTKYWCDGIVKCEYCSWVQINEKCNLSDRISEIDLEFSTSSTSNKFQLYELNSNFTKEYEFNIISERELKVVLYDNDFNIVPINDLNSNINEFLLIYEMTEGSKYYLNVGLINNNDNSIIHTKIISKNSLELVLGENDLLINQYNNIDSYAYMNTSERGLYNISLNASTPSSEIIYPSYSIKIYRDSSRQELFTRLETDFYTLSSETSVESDNLIVFLEYNQTIYIDINLPDNTYSSISLNIEKIEDTYEINMFNYEEDVYEEEVILYEDTSNYGDYIQRLEIKQDGIYNISYIHDGPQYEGNLLYQENPQYLYYAFYKEKIGPLEEKGNIELLLPHMATTVGGTISFEYFLEQGVYYIGYYNKLNYEPMTILINYIINEYDNDKIISDPDFETDCGSMINIYEKGTTHKSIRGSNIVVGFTRILYLDPILEIETRTDYKWYSSDENIATISQFGTIFGKSVGIVKIMAVNKNNPKVVYVKTFNIINDASIDTTEKVSIINDTHNSDESIYTIGLTILNSPYPSYYLYNWQIISYDDTITNIEILGHGMVSIEGYGNVIIKGSNYYYNSKYSVQINLVVS